MYQNTIFLERNKTKCLNIMCLYKPGMLLGGFPLPLDESMAFCKNSVKTPLPRFYEILKE